MDPSNSTLHVLEERKCLVCSFVCLFVLYQYILYGLILIAGRPFLILLFLCLSLFYKLYQKEDEHMKNVYFSSKQISENGCLEG